MSKVLIVDDEIELCSTIADFLRPRGYEVFTANSGKEGLSAARSRMPDVILLDLMLPDMDGWRVCQALKKDEALRGIPVIMLSALVDDQQQKGAHELGDAYLSKPFAMKMLLEKLRLCLVAPS
jgi:DNA-binding response OmpR family regulator